MPAYQIHRLKETQRQQFRWAPHTPGVTIVKLKDYEPGSVVDAATPYALWLALRETENAIGVGDLIEIVGDTPGGEIRILKYIGFEEARWYAPEPAPHPTGEPVGVT
jgi:hypothetical protein